MSSTSFSPRMGARLSATMGETLMWYDGPVLFLCEGLDCVCLASAVHRKPGFPHDYVAIAMDEIEVALLKGGKADLRTLMTRPRARLYALDFIGDAAGSEAPAPLELTEILSPLPDAFLPASGVYHDGIFGRKNDDHAS